MAAANTNTVEVSVEGQAPRTATPETTGVEKREITPGGGGVDITRSPTLHSTPVPGDGDIEKTAGVDKKTDDNSAGDVGDSTGCPVSGTTIVVLGFSGTPKAEVVGEGIEGGKDDAETAPFGRQKKCHNESEKVGDFLCKHAR